MHSKKVWIYFITHWRTCIVLLITVLGGITRLFFWRGNVVSTFEELMDRFYDGPVLEYLEKRVTSLTAVNGIVTLNPHIVREQEICDNLNRGLGRVRGSLKRLARKGKVTPKGNDTWSYKSQ